MINMKMQTLEFTSVNKSSKSLAPILTTKNFDVTKFPTNMLTKISSTQILNEKKFCHDGTFYFQEF